MIICPNLSNPLVAQEFEELKNAVGETAAYHIWSLNNGYNIDSAPNGEPSILFQTLLKEFDGDRREAVRAKAKTYSNSFIKWFGDWINDHANASKVVDENGEPLVVYHGNRTDNKIEVFDLSKKGSEHIEREISGFWFVNSERIATNEYAFKPESWGTGNPKFGETIGVFLNIKNPVISEQDIKEEMSPYGLMQFSKEKTKDFIHNAKLRQTSSTDGFILTMLDSDGDSIFEQSKQIQFVAFNPNQIKSATDNIGTFSTENDDIYDQIEERPKVEMELDLARSSAVQNAVQSLLQLYPQTTLSQVTDIITETEERFNSSQQQIVGNSTVKTLMQAYGLEQQIDDNGNISLVGDDIAVQFVQYLQDEFGEHDGWYDYNSSSTAVHHLILVALNGDEISTFSHELAHHYIRMFFNTPLIQNSLGAVYKKGMTLQELEEALVDEITSRLPLIFDEKDLQKTFYGKFWSKFSEMLAKLFNIKNNTYKNDLLRNATRAFLINENQQTNPKYRAKFDKYEGRLYKDKNEYTKRKEKAQEEAKKSRFKSHYIKIGDHSEDQNVVKLIVEGGIRRKSGLEKSPSMTDKEIVQINAFEQHLLEFVDAINEQRKLEKERLTNIGLSERNAKRKMADTEEERRLNVGIITDFLDNAGRELNTVVDRFRSAQSSRYMKLTIRRDEDETTGDVRTLYVNSNEYDSDENVHQQDFSFEELSRLGRDTISYYKDTIEEIEQMLEDYYVRRLYSKEDLQRIRDKMEAVKKKTANISTLYKDALRERSVMFVNEYARNIKAEIDDDMRQRLEINIRKWIDGQYDLGMGSSSSIHAWLELWIGIGEWSQSPIVKMMHQMIFDANTENEDKLRKRRNELYIAREKAKKALGFSGLKYLFKSFDKQFMEVDENGLPTGNMQSKVNRGRYFLKRADFLDELLLGKDGIESKLRKTLGDPNYTLGIDSDGFPVFPQDPRATDVEIEYTVKYNEFLSKYTHRQYTPEYYRKRLQILCDLNDDMSIKPTSDTKALHAQNDIQSKIEKIVGPCTIDGKVHTELLEDHELIQLLILENKRRLLSSPYDDYGREKEPGTDEYIIYKRLDLWKRFIDTCNIVYTIDEEAFNLSAENAKNKKRFRKLNRYRKINDRFWKLYNDTLGNNQSDEILDDLKRKRSQLVAAIKPRGLLLTDFSIVWDENEGAIRPEWVPFFENLKKLDTQIKNRELELSKNKKRTSKQSQFIDSMLDVRDSIYKDGEEPQTWFVHMSKGIKKRHYATNAPGAKRNAEEEIRKLLMYKASDGKNRELSLFTTTYPKQSTLKDKDGEFKAVIFEPIHAYSRINVEESSGLWVNKEYDHNSDETVQPKGFDNPDFEKIAGEKAPAAVREYYELLKQTMEESYLNIPFLRKYNMMLPQRAARTSTVLYRSRLWGCWKYLWNRFWSINEEDTDINEVYFKERSDRTITGSVPVRYIKRLDRPEFVSSDLMSTVLSFYSMSLNYDSHSKLAPIFKSLHEQMIIKNPTSKQAQVVKGMIYRQIYGKKTTGMPDGVLSNRMKVLIKFIQRTRVGSMIALLGYSGLAAVVAVLDALTSGVVDVTTRRSFGYSDLMWAIGKMMLQTPAVVSNIGAIKKGQIFGYGTLPQMLEEFGLGGDVSRSTINSDVNRIRRIFNDGIITTSAMAPWSAGEHFINSLTLLLNMSSYRLYNGLFLSRSEFLKIAMQDGLTRMEARVKYQKATKLYNAYKINKNTGLVEKADNDGGRALSNMSNEEYRKFKNRVTAKGVSKAASYNALVPEFERTQFQSNIIFSWVSMMRNFLLIAFWERFADLNDFYDPVIEDGMSEGDKKNMRRELGEYAGGLNMMTGEVTTGRTRAFFNQIAPFVKVALPFLGESGEWQKAQCSAMVKYLWKQVSDKNFNKYEYRKENHLSEAQLHGFNIALNEIIAIGLFVYLSTWFHNKYNDDHEDEYWFLAIDTVLLRLPIERFTVWNVGTIMEIINSITAGKTVFDRIVVGDFIKLAMKDYLNHGTEFSKYEEVKRGAFKGEKILFRDALKIMSFLGFYNLYRATHTESIKSAKRFYEKLGGFNPSSWWRKSDDDEKKDKKSTKKKTATVVI